MQKFTSVFFILVGCSASHVEIPQKQDALDDLDLALEAWAESEPTSYRYAMVYSDNGSCVRYEYVVRVRNGRTDSSRSRPIPSSCDQPDVDVREKSAKPLFHAGATITDLLTYIAQIDCPLYTTHSQGIRCPRDGALFEAHYHPQMGFPISFRYIYGRLLDERIRPLLDDQENEQDFEHKYDFEYQITAFQIVE